MIRKIFNVEYEGDYLLICSMENGDIYQFDMSYLKEKKGPMREPLSELSFFQQVQLDEYGNLSWPNGYEVSANTVAEGGMLIKKSA